CCSVWLVPKIISPVLKRLIHSCARCSSLDCYYLVSSKCIPLPFCCSQFVLYCRIGIFFWHRNRSCGKNKDGRHYFTRM
uniref:Uncharacterized protein n=1 Tax=Anopheles dirus TaxID=7168 RepID=A0A182NWR6_9DIPT